MAKYDYQKIGADYTQHLIDQITGKSENGKEPDKEGEKEENNKQKIDDKSEINFREIEIKTEQHL